ncbi:hypothetical protein CcrColossus_gp350 [Caulobacter phage CcrColossus]|uniref:Uncharacterized protein n=1 Tax=Caulobacter phage CcrColossus TaxID=1211640 RepID=K4JV30_9CAUD|nr:hypothetical protein CcrColossus_gp350 [Caulobacter phage CcrColossus]AFU88220.1 hypothetical protein CcrColossus_gp350 [Caulobacter phage CcrColossus]
MSGSNLYGGNVPFMVNSGTFGRCKHGHTRYMPCWRCGVWHPIKFLRHLIANLKG